jgi:hypothetical protein
MSFAPESVLRKLGRNNQQCSEMKRALQGEGLNLNFASTFLLSK